MLYLILVAIMIFFSVSFSGLFLPAFPEGQTASATSSAYKCCDTGDGENCKPQTNLPTVQYKNDTYALLKTDIYLYDYGMEFLTTEHLDPAKPVVRLGPRNERVFLNRGEKRGGQVYPECTNKSGDNDKNDGYDRLYGQPDPRNADNPTKPGCYKIPNDLLIYLCNNNGTPGACDGEDVANSVKFDVYIRMRDVIANGIPKVIKECYRPPAPAAENPRIMFRPSPEGQNNLQLRTFKFIEERPAATWLSPYCKPAIYLYPEKPTEVNVSVYPKGKMLLTIPEYPKLGWDVVANPNGDVLSAGQRFDYLYYEASIPDALIPKPTTGYVIPFAEREVFIRDLVVKLGLNEKETNQFVEYWAPILPDSPYYFIGIVPYTTLTDISPILITPKPKNIIRVTLYFQPLETKLPVKEPVITPVARDGFTAVEWGGIFKRDKNHPFSCFM